MVFDQGRHLSLCAYADLYARSFVISSFGKTYHVTGWKVGYCIAPPQLTREFRRVHQYVTFTVNTPVQLGIADFLQQHPEHHDSILCRVRAPIFSCSDTLMCPRSTMSSWRDGGPVSRASPQFRSVSFFRPPANASIGPCAFVLPRTTPRWPKRRRFYAAFNCEFDPRHHPLA